MVRMLSVDVRSQLHTSDAVSTGCEASWNHGLSERGGKIIRFVFLDSTASSLSLGPLY
jgi:hypothetical protein